MQWFARQVTNNSCLVILVVFVITATCIIVAVTIKKLPTFDEPVQGFEARGTKLAQKLRTWKNILRSTWNGPLTFHPNSITTNVINVSIRAAAPLKNVSHDLEDADNSSSYDLVLPWFPLDVEDRDFPDVAEEDAGRVVYEDPGSHFRQNRVLPFGSNNFFCNHPNRDYSHVIVQSATDKNLFTLESLKSICALDETKLRNSSYFPELCEKTRAHSCCKSWSIPNYIALLRNKPSCRDINETDVKSVFDLLTSCSSFYHDVKLSHDCATDSAMCRDVPRKCIEYDAVYNILHYLSDVNFLNPKLQQEIMSKLSYTSVFLPIAQSLEIIYYYRDLEMMPLKDDDVEVVGMELGLKDKLFDERMIHDTVYMAMSGCIIFILLWIYSSSFFVTFMTFMAVTFSFAMAYFMYTIVYQINYFPFMNMLAIVIVIGIGADDAFVYCKIWACYKTEKNNGTLVKLVQDTLHHACLSMFVTSITTAAAFFASIINNITAVRCFSIFAGTAVLANFLFTVCWLPASVILAEKWCSSTCCLCIPPLGVYLPQFQKIWRCTSFINFIWRLHYNFTDCCRVFFEKILPCVIVKSRYFLLVFLTAIAVGSAVIVFYYPKVSLPDSPEFQVFSIEHPFEQYNLVLKKQFWFGKAQEQDVNKKMPIRVVWGVLPIDNGNYLDPYSQGSLVFDTNFDIVAPESQVWLLDFCVQLRNQSFYHVMHGSMFSFCFIETFKNWMERRCVDGIRNTNRSPCCKDSKFPYTRAVFNICVREAIKILQHTPGYYLASSEEIVPRFSKASGEISVVVIECDSIFTYSYSYNEMLKFKTNVENWVEEIMKTAPPGLRNGWFTSDLEFFDLQDCLSEGTLFAIGVALSVSFIALLITTLNLLISIYAIVTIACVIIVTVASLVLLGWKLNVLESTTISVAIGLAVDLTLHYGVAYRLSDQEDRESSVVFALTHVGSPVAIAAFTTFMAGVLMFPSIVLAYLQTGKFLVILMTVSWLYSTFFFLSLLCVIGPQNGKFQLKYPTLHCCEANAIPVEKTPYALSESTLSSSSASYPNHIPTSESHELESLTMIKGNHIDVPKFVKKKRFHRTNRPRSESFSAMSQARDPTFPILLNMAPRKISLPTVNVTFHGDPSPGAVEGAASSSTIVCGDTDIQSVRKITSNSWISQKEVGT